MSNRIIFYKSEKEGQAKEVVCCPVIIIRTAFLLLTFQKNKGKGKVLSEVLVKDVKKNIEVKGITFRHIIGQEEKGEKDGRDGWPDRRLFKKDGETSALLSHNIGLIDKGVPNVTLSLSETDIRHRGCNIT